MPSDNGFDLNLSRERTFSGPPQEPAPAKPTMHLAVGRSYKDEGGHRVDIISTYTNGYGEEFLGLVYEKNVANSRRSPCRYMPNGRVEHEGHDDPMRKHSNLVAVWDAQEELRLALVAAIRQVEEDFKDRVFFSFDSASGNLVFIPEGKPC